MKCIFSNSLKYNRLHLPKRRLSFSLKCRINKRLSELRILRSPSEVEYNFKCLSLSRLWILNATDLPAGLLFSYFNWHFHLVWRRAKSDYIPISLEDNRANWVSERRHLLPMALFLRINISLVCKVPCNRYYIIHSIWLAWNTCHFSVTL